MATITSNASGAWATGATWVGGVKPADNDAVVIAAGHSVLMDDDTSAYTGLQTVTIQGHATAPAMLYFKDGTSGYLKIRTGYSLVGTSATLKGRLLANSDGVWSNTGSLAFADKAVIDLGATSTVNAQYLDIRLYGYNAMTNKYLRTYGVRHTVTGSASADTLTKVAHGLANTTPVMIMSSGTLPGGLAADTIYYVVNTAADTFKLASLSGGTAIDLTSDGTGTIEVYTGAASAANPVSVFEDVSAETGWTATAGHNRVVLANAGPQAYDQQRLTISSIAASAITLSAATDSTQYPGARIYLASRNVSIRSACTSTVFIVNYASNTSGAGVFQCEINSTAGTGTTFYGYGIYDGTGHTVSGSVAGCNIGVAYGTGHTISGVVTSCNSGVYYGTGHTISGTLGGCNTGVGWGVGHTISGAIVGSTFGIQAGSGYTISGSIVGSNSGIYLGVHHTISGVIAGCIYGVSSTICAITGAIGYNADGTIRSNSYDVRVTPDGILSRVVLRGSAKYRAPPTFYSRNTAINYGDQGIYCEDYNRTVGASRAFTIFGDVIKNESVLRSGGAASSIEVIPQSLCGTNGSVKIFEWTELSVPAAAQTKTVYVRGEGWTVWPTAAQLYLEAEYVSNATTLATTIVTSTAVLIDNTTWIAFPVTFTPAAAAHVRYRMYLNVYGASCKVYVDNQLT